MTSQKKISFIVVAGCLGLSALPSGFVPSTRGSIPPQHLEVLVGGVHGNTGFYSKSFGHTNVTACGAVFMLASVGVLMNNFAGKTSKQFQRVERGRQTTSVSAFENELGVQAPAGFWDPLGFCADGNVASFKRRRSVELKHSRICMLAAIGYMQPELTGKWPGFLSPSAGLKFADIPNGLGAISKVPALGWAQIVAFFGFTEFSGGFEDYKSGTPGDYGWKVLTSADMTERTKKLAAEIANGRLAMMSIIGMFFQDGLTGSAWGDWALYTGSPLRAYEQELGVQAPAGYWDPLGLGADGNLNAFRRRRSVELKHGRICMLACIGYIQPDFTGHWPGYLSPNLQLKFADVPNGLAAVKSVPATGWWQILSFCGFADVSGGFDDYKTGVPGDYGWKILTASDQRIRTKKLQAELANGRLAMFSIIGMFFQDGLTGTAWGDWSLYTASPLRAFENELGVQAPAGFWDPLGFTADGNVASFKRRRSVELKHSRICMLAAIGYMQPELTGKWPGFLSPSAGLKFADIPNGLGAISKVPALGWAQIVALFGFTEFSGGFEDYKSGTPGDYGWKVLTSADMTERTKKLAAEIANGRLAMMSIIGMFFQDGLTGSAWGDWALYTGSPLRAFENELGVQAPAGFWDPLGFTADGNVASFKRRRSVELKHSRICMLAAIGYMQPELTGKWPGFLSPSAGLKFADIPNGLGAISKVPALGWAQIVGFFGFTEFSGGFEDYKSGTPGDYGWKVLTSADMTERTKKLAAEIANGRLAMMSIIGMFFQDGLTGSAWGDWALYTGSPLRAFENELGVQAPAGFWDPLGFTSDGNVLSYRRRRSVELKHGRICMMSSMGYITPEVCGKWPGFLSPSAGLKFADIPNGLGAISKLPALGWAQIVAHAGFVELSGGFEDYKSGTPGDYGWKILSSPDVVQKTKKLAAEIANGRLAMMATVGMFFQDGLTGSAWGDWALYTGSPLRAFENELGVQAPAGFWDPLGFTADGNVASFKRRRSVELKHSRICMLAAIGYMQPELTGKWPGFLSPSAGLKFADIPNGLGAISKVPALGWAQIVALFGFTEFSGGFEDYKSGTPGDYGWKVLTSADMTERTKKLAAEIANGRLAMMSIIGMFFQDGLTGSAWGDWALYTGSPLRAFENELGVQPPLGYWDPMGIGAEGVAEDFVRRRQTEIKHGRVSMWACVGYMFPEFIRWPGYCSPSNNIKFEDIPNGLAALSKMPGAGWTQIILFCGCCEKGLLAQDPTRAPGDLNNAGVLGIPLAKSLPDGDARTRKLNAEIANGRLAMFSIIGMFFQDGLTGVPWGDWSTYYASPIRALPARTEQ